MKHVNFVAEPMGEKDVSEIAGIGPTLKIRLHNKGFKYVGFKLYVEKILTIHSPIIIFIFQAYNILGQYLLLNKNEELFQNWLKDQAGVNSKTAKEVYNCISEWTHAFL